MLDTPEIFWKGNGGVFNMTGGTILATGAYKQYDSQRWLARYPYGTQMVLDDASVFGVTPNVDDGGMYGVHIGSYNYQLPISKPTTRFSRTLRRLKCKMDTHMDQAHITGR